MTSSSATSRRSWGRLGDPRPVFTATVYVIVFGKFANFPAGEVPYPSLVYAGVLPMQYFASSLTGSSLSLASNLQLVTKVYFPGRSSRSRRSSSR